MKTEVNHNLSRVITNNSMREDTVYPIASHTLEINIVSGSLKGILPKKSTQRMNTREGI